MSKSGKNDCSICPICEKTFSYTEIEMHVNKCIFLNSVDSAESNTSTATTKKRPISPALQKRTDSDLGSPLKKQKNNSSIGNVDSPKSSKSSDVWPKSNTGTGSKPPQKTDMTSPRGFSPKTELNKKPFFSSQSVSLPSASASCSKNEKIQSNVPLAKQLQPKKLDDFVGQDHVLGENSVLRALLEKGDIPNMILWGPPGCGKTSLSGVIQGICKSDSGKWRFTTLCAATCGVKDVDNIVQTAKNQLKFGRRTVLFMDEIHRFNKKQQDIFLLYVEKGDIVLVGATTENPSFTINNALLSRCRVVVLNKLEPDNLCEILERAAESIDVGLCKEGATLNGNADSKIVISDEVLQWLADISDGDARVALNNLELVLQSSNRKILSVDEVRDKIKNSHLLYDRKGEEHYNIISAMHKSIRGSDVNAALYWTTRMILSGEDPLYIARRMVRAASEDIGNADPNALPLAISTMQGCQLLGMPECDVLLAQCAIYLSRAPKSREADSALAKAKSTIKSCKGIQPSVPMHLRNAPTRLMKDLGYGKLAEQEEFTFMPPELSNVKFLP